MAVDVKKWLAEKAAEIGLDPAELPVVEKLVGSNTFRSDFVPTSEFHSALDKQKNTFQNQYNEVVDLNKRWQEAYSTEYAPAIEALERLRQSGYDVSGVTVNRQGDMTDSKGKSISLDDVQALIQQAVEPTRAGVVEWSTFIADKAPDYKDQYGKKFPVADFRKFGFENKDKYPTLESAYDAFTAQDRAAKEDRDREAWREAERQKIRLEVMSERAFPEGSGMESSPAFLASEQKESSTREESMKQFASKFGDINIKI
jgi:hypothetical protein